MGSFLGVAKKAFLDQRVWRWDVEVRFIGIKQKTALQVPVFHLLPSHCGRSPILSSSSPEEKPESRSCAIGSIWFSHYPHWTSLAFIPAVLWPGLCFLARLPFGALLELCACDPYGCCEERMYKPRGVLNEGTGITGRRKSLPLLGWLYYPWLGKAQALFQTNQSVSQSFLGLCWFFPLTNHFLDHQEFYIPYPMWTFSQAK